MSLTRIANFNIDRRPLFSGIFGPGVNDVFIDDDLRECGLDEILYRDFSARGYTVIFYSQDPGRNFFSFSKRDLAEFFNLRRRSQSGQQPIQQVSPVSNSGHYTAQIDSPFGRRRRGNIQPETPHQTPTGQQSGQISDDEIDGQQIQTVETVIGKRLYRIANDTRPFSIIKNYIESHPQQKIVFIFWTAAEDHFSDSDNIDAELSTLKRDFTSHHYNARIVAIYDVATSTGLFENSQGQLFRNEFFRDELSSHTETGASPSCQLYSIGSPDREEYRNLINRRRLLDKMPEILASPGIERAAICLSQLTTPRQRGEGTVSYIGHIERMHHYSTMPAEELARILNNFDTENAFDKLRTMPGTEKIAISIERYIRALKRKNGPRTRPHLIFYGNPGTGKTTVARLLADILREKGLLKRGHLIDAKVGDLIGQYVGETRIKTQALCDRARGGVLFIDEAYGLMSGKSDHGSVDYGAEAIEVLIQFMENDPDSLVILAGYKADMENLINNGNQGFRRRFNGKESWIHFDDYRPDVLYKIFQRQIKGYATTEQFDTMIQRVIENEYDHRDSRWGNAGEMEQLAAAIINIYDDRIGDGPLSVDDIPAEKRRRVDVTFTIDEVMEDIDKLHGLKTLKQEIRELVASKMGERINALRGFNTSTGKPILNFIFSGAPGTGKTTVANLMATALYKAGIISSDETVIVNTSDIIKSEHGGTAAAVHKLFRDHSGKVLFIDEAYKFLKYGNETIDEIVTLTLQEAYRGNQALIIAGYDKDIDMLISSNEGARSRFPYHWHFDDFTDSQLWDIIKEKLSAMRFTIDNEPECLALATDFFSIIRKGGDFGNVRTAIELFNRLVGRYNVSICNGTEPDMTIRPMHFPTYKNQ